jgi:hypothetical protein
MASCHRLSNAESRIYALVYTSLCTKEGIPDSTLLSFLVRLLSCERADGS